MMPVEHSPIHTPGGSTAFPENLQEQNPDVNRTLLSAGDDFGHPGDTREVHSNEFRLLKLPKFWHKQPKLWFAQVESEFLVYRIRSDEVKYSFVIRHLDEQALIAVSEVIENPPEKDKYSYLKNMLINRFTDSEEKRLRQLLAGIELNDKKPTELLRELKQLAGGTISENVLHSIWLQRLPYSVQAPLAVVGECPLMKLAELADKIIGRDTGLQVATVDSPSELSSNFADLERRIAALEVRHPRNRSRSRFNANKRFRSSSRNRSWKNYNKNNNLSKSDKNEVQTCFYHKKFGENAKKCTIPCAMSKSLTQKSEN